MVMSIQHSNVLTVFSILLRCKGRLVFINDIFLEELINNMMGHFSEQVTFRSSQQLHFV